MMSNLFYIRLIEIFQRSVAVYPNGTAAVVNNWSPSIIHFRLTMLTAFFIIAHQLIYLKFAENLNEILDISGCLCHTIYATVTFIVLNVKGDCLKRIIVDIRTGLFEYSAFLIEHDYHHNDDDQKLKTKLITFTIAYNAIFCSALLSPLMNLQLYGGMPPELNPNSSLLVAGWFPWRLDSVPFYLLAYVIQLVFLIPMLTFVPLNPVFIYYFSAEIDKQKRRLCYVIDRSTIYRLVNEVNIFKTFKRNKN